MQNNTHFYVSENLDPSQVAIGLATTAAKNNNSSLIIYRENRYSKFYECGNEDIKKQWNSINVKMCSNFIELQTVILNLPITPFNYLIIDKYSDFVNTEKSMEVFSSFTKLCFILEFVKDFVNEVCIIDVPSVLNYSIQSQDFRTLLILKLGKIYQFLQYENNISCYEISRQYAEIKSKILIENKEVLDPHISKLIDELNILQFGLQLYDTKRYN